jgi:phosphoglycerate dehydrogenase-like enzyme
MSFTLTLIPPGLAGLPAVLTDPFDQIVAQLEESVPGIKVIVPGSEEELSSALALTDAAYGLIPRRLFPLAKRLRWNAAPMNGLGEAWFYPELVASDVTVTNVSGIYSEQLAAHILGFILAFAHRFDTYFRQQAAETWAQAGTNMDLRRQTVLILGLGGSGKETARLCSAFGMRVLGCEVREQSTPPGVDTFVPWDDLPDKMGEADFVVLTVPETPATRGMFNDQLLSRMKRGSYIINIARGGLIKLDDLLAALTSGHLAGAGLDVSEIEPLPPGHALWNQPGVLITPHTAINGAAEDQRQRRNQILIDNAKRFAAGEPLDRVVDKHTWF